MNRGKICNESMSFSCNETRPPSKVLDKSTDTWQKGFDPSVEYAVPDPDTVIIGEK